MNTYFYCGIISVLKAYENNYTNYTLNNKSNTDLALIEAKFNNKM